MTHAEVKAVICRLDGDKGLTASHMCGAGCRKHPVAPAKRRRQWVFVLWHPFVTRLLEPGYDIHTIQELPGRKDIGTAMIRTHVLNKGGHGVLKPDRQDLNRFMQTA